jgi:RNA polymerase sigma-70 factor (ECF subfamily)
MSSPTPFQVHRPRLLRLAHRMLGSAADAEDIVQDAFVRLHQANDAQELRSTEAWLVTVVTRLAIDKLRGAKLERRSYVGPWLPEPWMTGQGNEAERGAPDAAAGAHEELSYAALVLLERLSPEERAVFLLRDVYDVDYPVVAEALGKSEAACRQLLHRARERLAEGRPRHTSTASERLDLLRRFQAAAQAQDDRALTALLAPGVTYTPDGGGKVFASPRVLEGVARIVNLVLTSTRKATGRELVVTLADGEPAIVSYRGDEVYSLTFLEADASGIVAVYRIFNPEKLRRVPASP